MFCPENGVCNYLALGKIYGMLTLWIRDFSPPELLGLYVAYLKNDLANGGGGGGHPRTPLATLPSTYNIQGLGEKLAVSLGNNNCLISFTS